MVMNYRGVVFVTKMLLYDAMIVMMTFTVNDASGIKFF